MAEFLKQLLFFVIRTMFYGYVWYHVGYILGTLFSAFLAASFLVLLWTILIVCI